MVIQCPDIDQNNTDAYHLLQLPSPGQPLGSQHLLSSRPLPKVIPQHLSQQQAQLPTQLSWHFEWLGLLAGHLGRKGSHHHPVNDDPKRPHICWFSVVALPLSDLWGDVVGGAAVVVEDVVFGGQEDAEAEVDELHLELLAHQHVLQLQIPVHHLAGMAEGDCPDQLPHHELGNVLIDGLAALPLEVVAQRPVLEHFGDDANRVLGLDVLMEMQNQRVLQHGEDFELLLEVADAVLVAERCLEVGLDCDLLARGQVGGGPDDRVSSLSNHSPQSVLLESFSQKIHLGETFLVPVPERVLQGLDAVLSPHEGVSLTDFGEALLLQTAVLAQLDLLEGQQVRLLEQGQLFMGVAKHSVLGPFQGGRLVLILLADLANVGQSHQLPQLQL